MAAKKNKKTSKTIKASGTVARETEARAAVDKILGAKVPPKKKKAKPTKAGGKTAKKSGKSKAKGNAVHVEHSLPGTKKHPGKTVKYAVEKGALRSDVKKVSPVKKGRWHWANLPSMRGKSLWGYGPYATPFKTVTSNAVVDLVEAATDAAIATALKHDAALLVKRPFTGAKIDHIQAAGLHYAAGVVNDVMLAIQKHRIPLAVVSYLVSPEGTDLLLRDGGIIGDEQLAEVVGGQPISALNEALKHNVQWHCYKAAVREIVRRMCKKAGIKVPVTKPTPVYTIEVK